LHVLCFQGNGFKSDARGTQESPWTPPPSPHPNACLWANSSPSRQGARQGVDGRRWRTLFGGRAPIHGKTAVPRPGIMIGAPGTRARGVYTDRERIGGSCAVTRTLSRTRSKTCGTARPDPPGRPGRAVRRWRMRSPQAQSHRKVRSVYLALPAQTLKASQLRRTCPPIRTFLLCFHWSRLEYVQGPMSTSKGWFCRVTAT